MAKKEVSKELEGKRLREADLANMRNGAQELAVKRDELLQEIIELQTEIGGLEARKDELQTRLKQRMTGVVLCEKMIGHFGKLTPDEEARTG